MQPAYFSATVIALTLILTSASLLLFQWMTKLIQKQNQMWTTMMNLMASKDPMTFQSLQTTQNWTQNPVLPVLDDEPVSPLNDEVAAKRLASQYEKAGLDPNMAYARDENSVDFNAEFGL